MFQSTHPRGVRHFELSILFRIKIVSIHAPAWGATPDAVVPTALLGVSIHAPAWGATWKVENTVTRMILFQSTHPRGVRPRDKVFRAHSSMSFNPRTRVGCDFGIVSTVFFKFWFQSTHPRGVRLPAPDGHAKHEVRVSIHAPAWGATSTFMRIVRYTSEFQSTHPRGVRLDSFCGFIRRRNVSIHAPAWGATVFSVTCLPFR